ncbi:hypothetical protein [Roseofilum casamattae]|uniref:Uncharacterized protein n=1 Tax=Roseofilum casamattae BLCC-M143 TaxID=3022442 RepID=A0ABT7BX86_9CYAN|nr:hypothetical protein [Roseofilum casamattae]MDJ1183442.1 hypothetical protein [Roseofilum casamattae BLCC-M143]
MIRQITSASKVIQNWVQRVRAFIDPPPTPGSQIAPAIRAEDGEFIFYLNPLMVNQIESVRFSGDRLIVPPRQLARILLDLRELAVIDRDSSIQCGLTFKTFYAVRNGRQGKFLLRTVLSPDGDILNQVSRELLEDPECLRVVQSHNWLIDQLLGFLKLRSTQLADRISWVTTMMTIWIPNTVFTIRNAIVTLQQPEVLQNLLIKLGLWVLLPAIVGTILGFAFRSLLRRAIMSLAPRLSSWAMRELFTSEETFTKRVAKKIWGQFGV